MKHLHHFFKVNTVNAFCLTKKHTLKENTQKALRSYHVVIFDTCILVAKEPFEAALSSHNDVGVAGFLRMFIRSDHCR